MKVPFVKRSSVEIASEIAELRNEASTVSASIEAIIRGTEPANTAGEKLGKLRDKAEVIAARIGQKDAELVEARIREARGVYADALEGHKKAHAAFDKAKAAFLKDLLKTHDPRTAKRLLKTKPLWPRALQDLRIERRAALEKVQAASLALRDLGVFDAVIPDESDDEAGQAV